MLSVFLPESRYAGDAQLAPFYAEVVERLASVPGVYSATAVSSVPFGPVGISGEFSSIEGRPDPASGEELHVILRATGPSYFRTLGIPVLSGRSFVARDEAKGSNALVINQTMSRRFWPDESPLGHRIGSEDDWAEIVGVVGDVKNDGLEREPMPAAYFSMASFPMRYANLVVKTSSDPVRLADALRAAIRGVDADLPVSDIQTLDEIVGQSVADRRFKTLVLAVFAGLAIVLAAVGIYALTVTLGEPANIGNRHPHGARREDGGCLQVGAGRGARHEPARRGHRHRGSLLDHTPVGRRAIWPHRNRSINLRGGRRGTCGHRAAGLLHPSPPRNEGGPSRGSTG